MGWTPDEALLQRARAAGLIVTQTLPDLDLPWFTIETEDGRLLAEAQGFEAAKLAAKTQIEDGHDVVWAITPDGEWLIRARRCDRTGGVVCEYGDTVRRWDGRAA